MTAQLKMVAIQSLRKPQSSILKWNWTRELASINIQKTKSEKHKDQQSLVSTMKKKMKVQTRKTKVNSKRPLLTYAAPVWCHLESRPLKPLQTCQNKILRMVTNSNRYTRITKLLNRTRIEMIQYHLHRISSKFKPRQRSHQ